VTETAQPPTRCSQSEIPQSSRWRLLRDMVGKAIVTDTYVNVMCVQQPLILDDVLNASPMMTRHLTMH